MVIAGIPREEIRHTRAVQDWLAEGRQEGRQEGEAKGRQDDPPPTQPPLRFVERNHYRPDPGPTSGEAGSPGGRPARLSGSGRSGHLAGRQRLKLGLDSAVQTAGRTSVTADLPDLNLWMALACPSIRTEGGESAGVTVLLNTNVLFEPMRERPDAVVLLTDQAGMSFDARITSNDVAWTD